MEIQRLQEELRRRDEYQKAQEQYMKEHQEYWFRVQAQQQEAIQVSMNVNTLHFYLSQDLIFVRCILQAVFQQQGHNIVFPEMQPPPQPPQWGMFAQMPSPAA